MSSPQTSAPHAAAASGALMQLMSGYWVSQAVYAAARLGLPDLIQDAPKTAAELATQLNADEDFLYRLMRALGRLGVLTESDHKTFSLTPVGTLLQSDTPNSMRAIALMLGEEHYTAWGKLADGVLSGQTPFDAVYDMGVFEYYEKHPAAGETFNQAMSALSKNNLSIIATAYNFSQFSRVVDVGGGHGKLLSAILKQHPNLTGMVYDLPHVVDGAQRNFEANGLSDRAEACGGDFFAVIPAGADCYLMSHIIHDWRDAQARQILKNIHAAMPASGKLLLAEAVIRESDPSPMGPLMDLNMLVMTPGGRERTEEEFRQLLASAGFQLAQILPLTPTLSLLEAIKA